MGKKNSVTDKLLEHRVFPNGEIHDLNKRSMWLEQKTCTLRTYPPITGKNIFTHHLEHTKIGLKDVLCCLDYIKSIWRACASNIPMSRAKLSR